MIVLCSIVMLLVLTMVGGAVRDVSVDGRTIVGWGSRYAGPGQSQREAWIATIPEPSTTALLITGMLALALSAWRRRN